VEVFLCSLVQPYPVKFTTPLAEGLLRSSGDAFRWFFIQTLTSPGPCPARAARCPVTRRSCPHDGFSITVVNRAYIVLSGLVFLLDVFLVFLFGIVCFFFFFFFSASVFFVFLYCPACFFFFCFLLFGVFFFFW